VIKAGQSSVDGELRLTTTGVDQSLCVLTHHTLPDKPWVSESTTSLSPEPSQRVRLIDGRNTFDASCPSTVGPSTASARVRVVDGLPERCLDVTFDTGPITVDSLSSLKAGMIGSWRGCVTTPWVPVYGVDVVFRRDGTYSAISGESLDGQRMLAMYYGSDADSPQKRYEVLDLQDSLNGVGQIDIWFGPDNVNRSDLRNIKLMGDLLEFEFFHRGDYGPLTFQLERQ